MRAQSKGIADVLFEQKKINEDQLSTIKIESANTGKSVESIIKERDLVSSLDLTKARAESFGIDFIDPSVDTIPNEILDLIAEDVAKRNLLIPFQSQGGVLSLAMSDPLDIPAIELLERKTGLRIKPYMALPEKIQKAINDQYGRSIGRDVSEALGEEGDGATKLEENLKNVQEAEKIVQDSSVARVVSIILEYAAKVGASDIHIEPQENKTRVRYRIDGILQEKLSKLPKESHDSIIARIKILANLKIDERRKPQDGRFKIEIGGEKIDLRISVTPTVNGEKAVIRLLHDTGDVLKLKDLGLRGTALKNYERGLLRPHGIILVTGPTGSGKTVTLATSLRKINSIRVNTMTLEDPVEIRIPGVNQVQVNPEAGLTFANGLRSFLRQDPNIIMVGEIRDAETAGLAVQASLTGHLVLATLHTNSAAGAISRLLDMKVQNFLLASTVNTVIAQRLVRKICRYCKERYEAPEATAKDIKQILNDLLSKQLLEINKSAPLLSDKSLGRDEGKKIEEFEEEVSEMALDIPTGKASPNGPIYLYRGKGCEKCGDTGYVGRLGIFEVLDVTDKISTLIAGDVTMQTLQEEGIKNGMVTLLQDGYLKALEGITSLEEVLRVANE